MNDLTITVDDVALKAAFKRAPALVASRLNVWVATTAALAERTAKDKLRSEVSEGASGRTLNSIQNRAVGGTLTREVKPTAKYAYYVHEGRKPGKFPPFGKDSDLSAWARRMDMNPFLVARAIARHGTKGHPFMKEAYDEMHETANASADKMLDEIVREF